MAEVILAREIHSGVARTVVLKRVLPAFSDDGEFLRMFAHESELARQLRHPNVVQVLDTGVEDGLPYIAMEALVGLDLHTLMARAVGTGGLPVAVICAVMAD